MFKRTFKDFKNLKKWEHILLCWKMFNSQKYKHDIYVLNIKRKSKITIGVHDNCGVDFCLSLVTKFNKVVYFTYHDLSNEEISKLLEFNVEVVNGISNIKSFGRNTLIESNGNEYYVSKFYVKKFEKSQEIEKITENIVEEIDSEIIDW